MASSAAFLTLPLAKYSWTTDSLPWQHRTHDLFVVFTTFRPGGSPSTQLLKIVQGTQILLEIELENLITMANQKMAQLSARGEDVKAEQLPIWALVRCPALAFRYRLPEEPTKSYQFQIRMSSSADYDTVLNHIRRLGISIKTPSSNAAPASSTASQPRTSPSDSTTFAPAEFNRPYTAVAPSSSSTSSAPSLNRQLQNAAGTARPTSAFSGLASRHPLAPPEIFPRPDSSNLLYAERSSPLPIAIEDAGSAYSRPGTSESALPPRRELPFARPSSRSTGEDNARSTSRPNTAMGPPPSCGRSSGSPTSSRAGLDTDLPPLPRPTPARLGSAGKSSRGVDLTSSSETMDDRWSMARGDAANAHNSGTNPSHGTKAESSIPSRTGIQGTKSHPFPKEADVGYQERLVSELKGKGSDSALAGYAVQSEEGRIAALNDFIIRNLEDENFLTLVEDVETCWARIGLGMS